MSWQKLCCCCLLSFLIVGCEKPKFDSLSEIPADYYEVVQKYEDDQIKEVKFKYKIVLRNIAITPDWGDVEFYRNGQIKSIQPAEEVTIMGIRCDAGAGVVFYSSGQLRSAHLAAQQSVQGKDLAKESIIVLTTEGKLAGLAGKEILFAADGAIIPTLPRQVVFDMDGDGYGGVLSKSFKISGFHAKANTALCFHPNGALKWITLQEATTIQDKLYPANSGLELDEAGSVVREYDEKKQPLSFSHIQDW